MSTLSQHPFTKKLSRSLFTLSFLSLGLKLILQIGPIIPDLGTAVYGDRPLIIGYLHLVFLAFLTLYVLSSIIEDGHFHSDGRSIRISFGIFTFGVIANEVLLMLQGLGILFFYNTSVYNWLLWLNSIILAVGSAMIAIVQLRRTNNPSTGISPAE